MSYAHNDNQAYTSEAKGWVEALIDLLRIRIVKKIGSNALDIWTDYELAVNSPVTRTIMDALAGSAFLLFVTSESYLVSGWCKNELERFLDGSVVDRKPGDLKQLFMVKLEDIDAGCVEARNSLRLARLSKS